MIILISLFNKFLTQLLDVHVGRYIIGTLSQQMQVNKPRLKNYFRGAVASQYCTWPCRSMKDLSFSFQPVVKLLCNRHNNKYSYTR